MSDLDYDGHLLGFIKCHLPTAVCGGAGEVFGLDPQAGEWALSRCTEELATVALGAVFATAFLLRLARARHCCAETPAQPVQSASIYGSDVDLSLQNLCARDAARPPQSECIFAVAQGPLHASFQTDLAPSSV